jgi:hypothetical protein
MSDEEKSDLVGKIVLDLSRQFAGRVRALHAPNEYVSPINRQPVDCPVLELETGESFVLKSREHFATLVVVEDERVVEYYADVWKLVQETTRLSCGVAAKIGIAPQVAFLMVGKALQAQGGILLRRQQEEAHGGGAEAASG